MNKTITALLMGLLCFTSIGCGGDDEAERNRQNFKKDMDNLDDAFNNSGLDQPRGSNSSGNTSAINLSELESLLGPFAQQTLDNSRWLQKENFLQAAHRYSKNRLTGLPVPCPHALAFST